MEILPKSDLLELFRIQTTNCNDKRALKQLESQNGE